jgi:hypothetical protein
LLEPIFQARRRGIDFYIAGEKCGGLCQTGNRNDVDLFHHGRFGGAFGRHNNAADARLLGGSHGHGQRAFGGARCTVGRQFANDGVLIEQVGLQLAAAGQNAKRNGQIERPGVLGQFGRGEIDDDFILRPHEAAVDHRALHAMRTFLDRCFGQTDKNGFGQRAGGDIDFDIDRQGIDSE